MKEYRDKLLRLIKERAYQEGKQFVLSSGKVSDYYIDGKRVTLDSEGLWYLSEIILAIIVKHQIKIIGGMELGAVPIVAGVLVRAGECGFPLHGLIVRKQKKGHGTAKEIEGELNPGDEVALVDDVVTTGSSLIKCIEVMEQKRAMVKKVIAMVDRNEGAKENLAKVGYELEAIFNVSEIRSLL